jgi:uncharacterized protein
MLGSVAATAEQRVGQLDWASISQSLDLYGYATTPPLLTPGECAGLVSLYAQDNRFRSRVDMARYNFGSGEYKYLQRPLPPLVEHLRTAFYSHLAPVASSWAARLGAPDYPPELQAFLDVCAAHGQTKPTPLLLRYLAGDYNCLHQDLYGEVAFPIQITFALSRLGGDYTGGEFLLLEQRPRAQSRGQAITLQRGEAVIFATHHRPVQGTRGYYRANMRHGVSRLLSGERYSLGIIFHDAS